jgi:hypothetical protein
MAKRSPKRPQKAAESVIPEPVAVPDSGLALWLQSGRRQFWLGIGFLLLLTLLQFGGVLFTSGRPVLGSLDSDGPAAFGPWRAFVTRSMHEGIFPLWNPHVFSGQPYFGTGEAPLLYPPTWLHRILPLDKAINVIIVMHVFWIGLGMYLWALQQKLRPASALIAAMAVMFGGTFFFHVYACHIDNISTMAWVPFLFLAIDLIFGGQYWEGLLVGSLSFGMEILAGQPQYTFFAVVAMIVYVIARLIRAAEWPKKIGVLAAATAIGVGFTSFQLMLVLPQVQESIRRSGGVPRGFAAIFAFPPENLVTLLVPGLFGNDLDFPYWGRCYVWEMSLFMGVSGFLLALYGLITPPFPWRGEGPGERGNPRKWIWGGMAVLMFVLALGVHTPLFDVLFGYVPGFNQFRGYSKFAFDGSLFGALLAAEGFDRLAVSQAARPRAANGMGRWIVAGVAVALAIATLSFGLTIRPENGAASDFWQSRIVSMLSTNETYAASVASTTMPDGNHMINEDFAAHSASFASNQLIVAAVLLLVAGALIALATRPWPRYALFVMVAMELFVFAHHFRPTFDLSAIAGPTITTFLKQSVPGDYRTLNEAWRNGAVETGGHDIWGYDSFKLRRYAEFIAFAQGRALTYDNLMSQTLTHPGPLLGLVRLRYIVEPDKVDFVTGDLPHVLLVNSYSVVQGRDNIFATLGSQTFNPFYQVVLETNPVPAPMDAGAPGTAQVRHEDANSLTIDANLKHNAILLITDSYSRYWKAVALPGSAQTSYQVLPADYTLRAIPLTAGVHHIRVVFEPPGMLAGALISAAFVALYLILLLRYAQVRVATAHGS